MVLWDAIIFNEYLLITKNSWYMIDLETYCLICTVAKSIIYILFLSLCEWTNAPLYAKHQWPIQWVEHAHVSVVQEAVSFRTMSLPNWQTNKTAQAFGLLPWMLVFSCCFSSEWVGFHSRWDSQMEKFGPASLSHVLSCSVFGQKLQDWWLQPKTNHKNHFPVITQGKHTVKHQMLSSGNLIYRYGESACLMANHLRNMPCFKAVLDFQIVGCIACHKNLHFEPGDISSHWPRLMQNITGVTLVLKFHYVAGVLWTYHA